ncbi:MAG: amidase [Methyloligellaceae bacterium]
MPAADQNWFGKPLTAIAAALRDRRVTAAALLETARHNHASHGARLDAYRIWSSEPAGMQAQAADAAFAEGRDGSPLQGIPVSVKDLFGVDYLDTTAGSPRPLPESWNREGPIIRALRRGGAVLTGKTHMVEFAFGGLGTNAHWPIPRNPWDAATKRVPGGSSSGAGVSLVEGSCLLALGTDTAGSVRVPASFTGTVGLKTTAGRWPLEGIVPLSPTFDTPGILARDVGDAAFAYAAIEAALADGAPPRPTARRELAGLRIAIPENHFWEACSSGIGDHVHAALRELENAGATLLPVTLPEADEAFDLFCKGSVVASELNAFLQAQLPDWIATLDPNIAKRMAAALDLDSDEIAARRLRIAELTRAAQERFAAWDIMVTPTVQITPPPIAEVEDPKAYSASNLLSLRNTCIANLLGLCAITMPVALDSAGMPVGLQCMARAHGEDALLAAAAAIEGILGTPAQRLGRAPLGA